jgi:surface carbohydrate biosynthesis protein
MKGVFFIRPKTYSLLVVPHFLKKIFIKKKYYLLPNNKYLRKIIIIFYLKFLRKLKLFFNLISESKIIWSNPKEFRYIVFDDISLGTVDKILPKNRFFILATRIENIKEIYISTDILIYILKNIFKSSLKVNYICSLIKYIKPKKIVTIVDNSHDFHFIFNRFKNSNISFYAIQNAYRHNIYLKQLFSLSNYSGNYFCFGDYELNCIKSNKTIKEDLNVKSIGSLRIEVAKEYLLKNKKKDFQKKYDVCFISEAVFRMYSEGASNDTPYVDSHKSSIKLLQYVLTFCEKNKKKLLFLGRDNTIQNKEDSKEEEILYYRYKNKNKNFNIQFFDKTKFEHIKHLLRSDVVVGTASTLLRESFGLKKKILVCEWRKKSNYLGTAFFPSSGIIKLESQKYFDFEKRMKKILSLNYKQYLSSVTNPKLTYNLNFNTLKFLRKEMLK